MRQFLMIASAAVVLATATPAAPQHASRIDANPANVRLADLDLRLPAGRAQAFVRIEAVAAKLCRKAGTYAARKACREAVIGKAAQQPGSAFVTVALAERSQANVH